MEPGRTRLGHPESEEGLWFEFTQVFSRAPPHLVFYPQDWGNNAWGVGQGPGIAWAGLLWTLAFGRPLMPGLLLLTAGFINTYCT